MSRGINRIEPSPQLQPPGFPGKIARFFKFEENRTNFRTELLAGVTTFMAMAYILIVNPSILSNAIFLQQTGDLFSELVIATAIPSAIATLLLGLTANYPIACAPAMGLNAFFAVTVVQGLGIDWRVALAAVFIEGLIFIALTASKIRTQIIEAFPESLKQAVAVGIGFFIAYIGLSGDPASGGAGIIVANEATKTTLGAFNQPPTLMAIFGILITAAFMVRRLKGALLWGILATALLGWILGITPWPSGVFALPPWPSNLLGQGIIGLTGILRTNIWDFLAVLFVFVFVDLFDTLGTLMGVAIQGGYIKENGEFPRAGNALMSDAIGTTVGGAMGTSALSAYIESAAGIAEGGRTGFTVVVTAVLLAVAMFFIPVLKAIPAYATAPALVIVGVLMVENIKHIPWGDPAEAIPAFLTILIMPLSYSIAEGIAVGFATYPIIKAFQGKAHEITPMMWILAVIFVLRFVQMAFQGHA
jgi:AGZA family xanthine/uracil permease-like MFS transporter